MPSGSDKAHKAELNRREAIWKRMQVAAKAALEGVLVEARNRGLRGTSWVSYYTTDYIWVGCELRPKQNGKPIFTYIRLKGTGQIAPETPDESYKGYPDLADTAADTFAESTAKMLLSHLNEYCRLRLKK